MRVVWIVQKGDTGAREQSFELAAGFDDLIPIYGQPLGMGHEEPVLVDSDGVHHATESLDAAVRALRPDVAVFHNVNDRVLREAPKIQQHTPTVLRAGMNFLESVMSGHRHARGVPRMMQFVQARDHLVAPSAATKRDLGTLGIDTDRISVIPTAVSMAEDLVCEPEPVAPAVVGQLSARISPLKNQQTTIKAIGGVRDLDTTEHIGAFITGRLNQLGQVFRQQVAQMGLADRVRFVGYVDDPDETFWPQVGVHVCPSFSERHPQAVLEAARAGVPTVLADAGWAGAFPDSFPRCHPDDSGAWARTVDELMREDLARARMATDQQEFVREHCSLAAVIPQYVEVLERVVDRVDPLTLRGGGTA